MMPRKRESLLLCLLLICSVSGSSADDDVAAPIAVVARDPGGARTYSAHLYPYYYAGSTIGYAFTLGGAAGDYDRDGHLDVLLPAIRNVYGDEKEVITFEGEIVVAYGDGSGAFPRVERIHQDDVATALSLSDLDSDGFLDVLFYVSDVDEAGEPVARVVILFGSRSGRVRESSQYDAPVLGTRAIAEDIDRDGHLDLLVPYVSLNERFSIHVRLGDGVGSFGEPVSHSGDVDLLAMPQAVASADIDGDGLMDVIAAGRCVDNSPLVVFAYGTEAGGFTFQSREPKDGLNPMGIQVGDFDGDGRKDVSIALPWNMTASLDYFEETGQTSLLPEDDRIVVLRNCGDRVWEELELRSGVQSMTLASADLNRDGVLDLVAFDRMGNAGVILGGSDLSLAQSQVYTCLMSAPGPPVVALLGNFTDDEQIDLVAQSAGGSLALRYGDGAGGFGPGWFGAPIDTLIPFGSDLVDPPADFDQDGHLDLVYYEDRHGVGVAFGDGTGQFEDCGLLIDLQGINVRDVAVGDFNGDGFSDVLVGAAVEYLSTGLWLFFGTGERIFLANREPVLSLDQTVWELRSGSLNQDDIADVLVVPVSDLSFTLLGTPHGEFDRGPDVPLPFDLERVGLHSSLLGDFNGDGELDLLATTERDELLNYATTLWLGNGRGGFGFANTLPEVYVSGLADFDGDGNLDFAGSDPDGPGNWVFFGDGTGSFSPRDSTFTTRALSDLSGDGYVDGVSGAGYELGVELGDAFGNRLTRAAFANQGHPREGTELGVVGDFNEDGWLDLAVANRRYISVLLNRLLDYR
jgi:hypothetical protein